MREWQTEVANADVRLASLEAALKVARERHGAAEYAQFLEERAAAQASPPRAEVDADDGSDSAVVSEGPDGDDLDAPWQWSAWISHTSVPTSARQRQAALDLEAGVIAEAVLAGEWSVPTPASDDELRALVESGRRAFNELFEGNVRLVFYWARKYGRGDSDATQDYFQDGSLGLWRAIQGWDALLGYAFSTYATWHVRQAMERGRMLRRGAVHVPIHVQEQWDAARRSGAEVSGLALEALRWVERVTSYESFGEQVLGTELEPAFEVPFDEVILDGLVAEMVSRESFDCLSTREAEVLARRLGFFGVPETLETIGERIGVTRERTRQIESTAVGRVLHYWLLKDVSWSGSASVPPPSELAAPRKERAPRRDVFEMLRHRLQACDLSSWHK